MIDNFIMYLKAFKRLIWRDGSLQKAKFYLYEQGKDVSKYDNEMLIAQLGYFGHHVEKALKHHNRGSRGLFRRDKLYLLIKEVEKRNIYEPEVLKWAKSLINYYDNNQELYVDYIDEVMEHPRREEILSFIKQLHVYVLLFFWWRV